MPPKNFTPPRLPVSPMTRLRAWYYGVDGQLLARYGDRGPLRHLWMEWRGALVIAGCAFCFFVSRQQSNAAHTVLENIELNRQSFYKKSFAPEYVGGPGGVYDGVTGYSSVDTQSGLLVNADGRLVSRDDADTMRERLSSAAVTSDMLAEAQSLLSSSRYQH